MPARAVTSEAEHNRVPRAEPELDPAMLERAQSGDVDAERALVLRYQRPVFALISRIVGLAPR